MFAIKIPDPEDSRETTPTLGECRWIMKTAYTAVKALRKILLSTHESTSNAFASTWQMDFHLKNDGNKMPNCPKVIPFYIIFDSLIYSITFSFESLQFVVRWIALFPFRTDSTRPEIIVLHAFAFDFFLVVFGPSAFMRALHTSNRLCHSHRRRLLACAECHDSIDPCCALSVSPLQLQVDTNKAFFFLFEGMNTRGKRMEK